MCSHDVLCAVTTYYVQLRRTMCSHDVPCAVTTYYVQLLRTMCSYYVLCAVITYYCSHDVPCAVTTYHVQLRRTMCSHDVPRPGGSAPGTRVPDVLDGVGVVVATRGVAVGDEDTPGPFPPKQIARPLSGLGVVTRHTATV